MSESRLKLRISTLFNNRGFGLAETMVSIGVVGVLIVAVISQQKLSTKSISTVASDTTINDVVRMTLGEVTDQATCTANFGGKFKDASHTQLINSGTTQAFLRENDFYGVGGTTLEGNKTQAGEVQLIKIETQRVAADDNPYAMILRLTFSRKDAGGLFGNNTTIRDIVLNTVIDGSGKIESCFGDFNLLAQSAVKAACAEGTAPSGLSYVSRYEEPSITHPYGRCIHDAGDIITCTSGVLTRVDVAGGRPTYICGSLTSTCPIVGQFIIGFNDVTGQPICDYPLPKCLPGEVMTKGVGGQYTCREIDCSSRIPISAFGGFGPDGVPLCNQITAANSCPDSFVSSINADGTVTCSEVKILGVTCPVGQRLNRVDINGNAICTPYINLPINCPAPQVLKAIDINGNPVCEVKQRPLRCGSPNPTHSDLDCTNAGGSPQFLGNSSQSQCFFPGTTCPGGWLRCGSWTTQSDRLCTDTSNTYYCDANILTRTATQGAGAPVNTAATNSQTCYQWTGAPNNGQACTPVPIQTVSSVIDTVGCY